MEKFIKTFEQWTSNVAGDFDVNYGDKPEISEIVENTIKYIESNFDSLKNDVNYVEVNFRATGSDNVDQIIRITLKYSGSDKLPKHMVSFKYYTNKYRSFDITTDEYEYLSEFFKKITQKFRKKEQETVRDKILQEIDPVRITAKKYNM